MFAVLYDLKRQNRSKLDVRGAHARHMHYPWGTPVWCSQGDVKARSAGGQDKGVPPLGSVCHVLV